MYSYERRLSGALFFQSDVNSSDKEIFLYVYDRGNKLPNGKDRCLGMSSIVPCLVNNRTVELIFPLKVQPHDQEEVTGDVRLQVTYTHNQAVSQRFFLLYAKRNDPNDRFIILSIENFQVQGLCKERQTYS